MKLMYIPEKEYRRIIAYANCHVCKHRRNPFDEELGQPTGCCIDCCCSHSGTEFFEWPDNVKVFDLK